MGRQTMADLAVKYFKMRKHAVKESTLRCEESAVGKLVRWWDKTRKAPGSLDDEAMEEFLFGEDGLADRLAAASSFNTQLAQLRRFVEWLTRRKILSGDVLDAMRPLPTTSKVYTRISMGQIHTVIEECEDEWERWVLTLASQTLGRDGELRSLRLQDFNLATGRIAWRRHKTGDVDEMPITADLDRAYRRWVTFCTAAVGEPLRGEWFAVPARHPFKTPDDGWDWMIRPHAPRGSGLSRVVQSHVARLLQIDQKELKGQGVHLIRRSMARALYDRLVEMGHGDPLRVVMTMLGHATPTVTEKYLGIKADRERRNALLAGSDILSVPTDNVVQLEVAGEGPTRLGVAHG